MLDKNKDMKKLLNKICNSIRNKIIGFGLKFHEFLKSGGWVEIIAVGAFGILCASAGMIRILIDSYNESGADPVFWFMVVVGAIVWGTLAFAVWAIARLIRRHRDIFKV